MRVFKGISRNTWLFPLFLIISGGFFYFFASDDYIFVILNILALQGLAVIGLNLLIDATGQVSIGHAAFYGIGAYSTALITVNLGWPLWMSIMLSMVLVALVAFFIAIPTVRLHGHYLVMATLGFNIIVTIVLNQWESLTGGPSGFAGIPQITDSDRSFFLLSWSILIVATGLTLWFQQTITGKVLKALRQNEVAVSSCGINTGLCKVFAFTLSALYAGFAGYLYAHYTSFISPKTFNIFRSLQWVTMSVLGGMGNVIGGVAGTAVLTTLPEFLHSLDEWHVLFYGVILMVCLVFFPNGLVPFFQAVFRKKKFSTHSPVASSSSITILSMLSKPRKEDALSIKDVDVNFGGLQVLSGINILLEPHKIHGIIGPNGAGKTTLFNVICGFQRVDSGKVFLGEACITGLPPYKISRLGIGRTFQNMQIFPELTVMEHLLVAHRKDDNNFLMNVLYFFDLAHLANTRAEELTLFDLKKLELARAVATCPIYVLLDEPCAGLNPAEKEKIGEYINRLHKHGVTVVLIDHHMDFIMNVADNIIVLHQGHIIAEGSPQEVRKQPEVVKAYLGTEDHGTVYHA